MTENVPKLMAYTKEHTHEAQRTPSRINTKKKKSPARHNIIQSIESQRKKEEILKEAREQIYFLYKTQSTSYSYRFPLFNKFSCEFLHLAWRGLDAEREVHRLVEYAITLS